MEQSISPNDATIHMNSGSSSSSYNNNNTSANNPMARMETVLQETLMDFHIRTQVQECLQSMLVDLELTHALGQQIQVQYHQSEVDRLTLEQIATMQDRWAQATIRTDAQEELADELVAELVTLSRELHQLTKWKQQHQHKVETYDELLAKLVQAEEELQAANIQAANRTPPRTGVASAPRPSPPSPAAKPTTSSSTSSRSDTKPTSSTTTTAPASPLPKMALPATDRDSHVEGETEKPESLIPEESTVALAKSEEEENNLAPTEVIGEIPPALSETVVAIPSAATPGTIVEIPPEPSNDDAGTDEKDNEMVTEPSTSAAVIKEAAVALDDDSEEETPGLVDIDVEVLMNIFGFLDAIDILNLAQINIAMYSRVDALFGIADDGHAPPVPSARQSKKPAVTSAPHVSQQQQQQQPPRPTIAGIPATSTSSPSASESAKKPDSKPAAATLPTPAIDSAAAAMGKGLFAMLQPRATNVATKPASGARRPETSPKSSQPWNPGVAQSMAAKLSDSELAAIIAMTEKLNKMEKEVTFLRNERGELRAKLDGTEAVKQFLIGKVRDVETKLNRSKEDEVKVTQQIASDQEVIAFLDGRVQELEKQTVTLVTEKSAAEEELKQLKASSSQKITVLSDILKYEREKLRENEAEWKATKKVLVKEVKNLRAQLLALQAERDGFKGQNEKLKRAIISTGKPGSPNGR